MAHESTEITTARLARANHQRSDLSWDCIGGNSVLLVAAGRAKTANWTGVRRKLPAQMHARFPKPRAVPLKTAANEIYNICQIFFPDNPTNPVNPVSKV